MFSPITSAAVAVVIAVAACTLRAAEGARAEVAETATPEHGIATTQQAHVGMRIGARGNFELTHHIGPSDAGGGEPPLPARAGWSRDVVKPIATRNGWTFLGSGAYGDVWRGLDHETGEAVVVKLFTEERGNRYLSGGATSLQSRQRLVAEEWACSQIRKLLDIAAGTVPPHPGADRLCACREARTTDSSSLAYVVMDYCGDSLRRARSSYQGEQGAAQITFQLLEALDLLSSASPPHVYIHHDLKPDNIAITQKRDGSPSVKIIDWGALQFTDPDLNMGLRSCPTSPDWAPLEALQNKNCWEASHPSAFDLYAVGAIYLYLLTGKVGGKLPKTSDANFFRSRASNLVSRMINRNSDMRPLPWQAAFHPAFAPWCSRFLIGAWHSAETERSYTLTPGAAGPLFPIRLTVLKSGRSKGAGDIESDTCNEPFARLQCCWVTVLYASQRRTITSVFTKLDRNVSMSVGLCPHSFWKLETKESFAGRGFSGPGLVLRERTMFTRAPSPGG